MKTIIVKTQSDLDSLPQKFDEYTVIEIRSDPGTWLKVTKARGSSRVEARGSSQVEAWDSSRVEARDSSRVEARDSSQVEAWDSSRVEAWDSSRVEAWGSSRVEARDSSRVEAWDSSRVEAWGSSRVEARDSSRVEARGSSQVEAWGSSRVEAWGSSRVVAHDFSMIAVLAATVIINKLGDYSVASLRNVKAKIEKKAKTATVIRTPERIERTFNEWLKQGYVHADGITKKLISQKKIGQNEIFEVEEFLSSKSSYVVKRGNTFSHGETVEKAIEGLRYKLSDRDTSKFKKWKIDEDKPVEDLISAYRAITGACEFGTKQFCESTKLKKKYSIKDVIEITKGKFGNEKFREFFGTSKAVRQ
jgi:hypothetical protein